LEPVQTFLDIARHPVTASIEIASEAYYPGVEKVFEGHLHFSKSAVEACRGVMEHVGAALGPELDRIRDRATEILDLEAKTLANWQWANRPVWQDYIEAAGLIFEGLGTLIDVVLDDPLLALEVLLEIGAAALSGGAALAAK